MAKKNQTNGSDHYIPKLSETAQDLFNFLENFIEKSEDQFLKNSKDISNNLSRYIRKYPMATTGSAIFIGGLIAWYILKSDSSFLETQTKKLEESMHASAENSVEHIEELLRQILEDAKMHSLEVGGTLLKNYVKKNPLPSTAAALMGGLLMSFLSRKRK